MLTVNTFLIVMLNKEITTCSRCGSKKELNFCAVCQMVTPSDIKISLFETIRLRPSLLIRKMRVGSKKFINEYLSGWFPSRDPKLPEGVHRHRTIDRENDKYNEVVRKSDTEEIVHECYQPLSQHRKYPK